MTGKSGAGIGVVLGLVAALAAGSLWAQSEDEVLTTQDEIGGVYQGTFRNGLQHGTGTYTLPNGYTYTGDWVDGEIRGEGKATFPNGAIYEGSFKKGHIYCSIYNRCLKQNH